MSNSQPDFDFPPSYIAGLLDATGRVRFPISETEDGHFTVHPVLRLYPYNSELRGNLIGTFLESQGYEYNYINRADSRDFFRVQFVSELADLQDYLAGQSTQLVRELGFVTGLFSDEFDGEILGPQRIYRFLRIRDQLRYGWRPRGIHHRAPSDIEADHDIDTDTVDIPVLPDGSFRGSYSIKYLAGLFDGAGRFRASVAKNDEHTIGYGIQPTARLYCGGVNSTLIAHVKQFCADYNLRVGDSSKTNTLSMVFTGPGAIRRILEVLYPQLFVAAEPAAVLDDAVFPRFDAGDHLTKQGFYEILTALDEVAALSGGEARHREYTPQHFADLWQDDIETSDPHALTEPPSKTMSSGPELEPNDPTDDSESLTLEQAAFTDTPGQYLTVVDRHHRDQEMVTDLKALYSDRCQVCGDRRARPDGTGFSEVHHIHPLGNPHNGPDTSDNMLVLCPNHHADFDNGVIAVDADTLTISHPYDRSIDGRSLMLRDDHTLDTTHLTYHNENIVSRSDATDHPSNTT
ncbi:HNH endonuclease [Haloferax marisrubri]|nr:HNH endonuclease [Haloferax marisrubri]